MATSRALKKLFSSTFSPNKSLLLIRPLATTTQSLSSPLFNTYAACGGLDRRSASSYSGSLFSPEKMVWPRCSGLNGVRVPGAGIAFSSSRSGMACSLHGRVQVRAMSTAGRSGRPLKYNKYRKGRCSKGFKADGSQLSFGRYGIKSCENGRISSRAIEAARRAIIGQFKRKGKVWIRVLADIPVTKKPTEVRMGRGKGNVAGWIARVSTGQILFEMDGVSLSDAQQAATLASHKLCLPTKFMIYS